MVKGFEAVFEGMRKTQKLNFFQPREKITCIDIKDILECLSYMRESGKTCSPSGTEATATRGQGSG